MASTPLCMPETASRCSVPRSVRQFSPAVSDRRFFYYILLFPNLQAQNAGRACLFEFRKKQLPTPAAKMSRMRRRPPRRHDRRRRERKHASFCGRTRRPGSSRKSGRKSAAASCSACSLCCGRAEPADHLTAKRRAFRAVGTDGSVPYARRGISCFICGRIRSAPTCSTSNDNLTAKCRDFLMKHPPTHVLCAGGFVFVCFFAARLAAPGKDQTG